MLFGFSFLFFFFIFPNLRIIVRFQFPFFCFLQIFTFSILQIILLSISFVWRKEVKRLKICKLSFFDVKFLIEYIFWYIHEIKKNVSSFFFFVLLATSSKIFLNKILQGIPQVVIKSFTSFSSLFIYFSVECMLQLLMGSKVLLFSANETLLGDNSFNYF